jgi:ribosomal protein S27E
MKNKFRIEAEIVKGECPTCNEITTLVGVSSQFFRCMECGADLEQHVNGKISYLPIMASRKDGGKPYIKDLMPFKSEKQRKYLFKNKPNVAKKFAKDSKKLIKCPMVLL